MTLSDRIRDQLKAELAPCPTCGHARSTIAALAKALGQPPSSVGKYLSGGRPTVALLDAAAGHLDSLAAALTQDEARDFLGGA